MADFHRYARGRHWEDALRSLVGRSLRIVLAWVGADAPIPEADIRSLPTDRRGTNAGRAVQFLAKRGLLIPDPDGQIDVHERVVEQRIQALPDALAEDLRRWVQVLRGEGRRPHPARSFETIRKYLGYAYPVLQRWGSEHDSLREITPEHIDRAMRGLTGHPANDRLTALHSIFRALKQERLTFRDPTRAVALASIARLPASIPTDQLRGIIDRATGPLAQLVVAPHRHPRTRQPRGHQAATGRSRPGTGQTRRPSRQRPLCRASRRIHSPPRPGLVAGTTPPVASNDQPAPARQPDVRRHGHPATDHHHAHLPHLPATRRQPVCPAARPDPRRSPTHRRPRPPHPCLRHQRHHRHGLRLRSPSRT